MNSDNKSISWFGMLRRDRSLFAIVGALVLVLNMLQPLAAAGLDADGRWIICTNGVVADDGNGKPGTISEKCPLCVAGHNCAAPLHKAINHSPAFEMSAAYSAKLAFSVAASAAYIPRSGRMPAIRAPPFSA